MLMLVLWVANSLTLGEFDIKKWGEVQNRVDRSVRETSTGFFILGVVTSFVFGIVLLIVGLTFL